LSARTDDRESKAASAKTAQLLKKEIMGGEVLSFKFSDFRLQI
jgi:hypothetical protein